MISRRGFLGALAGLVVAPRLIEKLRPVEFIPPDPWNPAEDTFSRALDAKMIEAQGIRFYVSRKVPTGWIFAQKNAAGDIIGLHMASGTLLELKGRK